MNNEVMYDQFSAVYDRFVNWEERLAHELPFLVSKLTGLNQIDSQPTCILDTACGTGHHLIALKENGFDVTGADISSKMVEIAQHNAQTAGLTIPFKQAGFGQLSKTFREQRFDGLLCLGNSLPHSLDDQALTKTLNDFRSVMRPGGILIVQNRNFDLVMKTKNRWMEPQSFREGGRTWIFVRFYDFDPDGLITFNILILSKQDQEDYQQQVISTRLRPLLERELISSLKKSGFVELELYGDLQGAAFDKNKSGNLVVIARTAD